MNPILIVGHKRSGTTHLARLLNLNPNIYIANELDVIWYAYQKYQKNRSSITAYPFDGGIGLQNFIKKNERIINTCKTPKELFEKSILNAMKNGFLAFGPQQKKNLIYLGDQKPFQQADPEIIEFVKSNIGTPYLIHIIRHPLEVLRSCKSFGKNKDGGHMWKSLSPNDILARWTKVEKWILKENMKNSKNIFHIKYEELTDTKSNEIIIESLFQFLNIETKDVQIYINSLRPRNKERMNLDLPDEVLRILEHYYT